MERIDWEFNKENSQKKNIGRSASKRVTKKKGCTLPSDHLTAAQKRKLNGEVISLNMNKPCRWAEFKLLSKDLQEKYINSLHDRFGAGRVDISRMFGINPQTFKSFVERSALDIFPANKGNKLSDPLGWENFKKGLLTVEASPNIEEGCFMKPEEKTNEIPVSDLINMPDEKEVKSFERFEISFNGIDNLDSIVQIIKNLPWEEDVRIHIEVGNKGIW